jgi:predicted  nucleic acid-binding Zn-ribbon protein
VEKDGEIELSQKHLEDMMVNNAKLSARVEELEKEADDGKVKVSRKTQTVHEIEDKQVQTDFVDRKPTPMQALSSFGGQSEDH